MDTREKMDLYIIDDSFVNETGQFDLTLVFDNHKVNVSKAVLCIASPVFRRMLESDFKEKGQSEVQLPEKNYDDFVKFLGCLYPDRLESETSKTVYGILSLAHEYQVKALESRCHSLLIRIVKGRYLTDVVEIYRHIQLSEMYNLDRLNQVCVSIASEFSLGEIEPAAKKYPISVQSLVKIHHLARKREELNKMDDDKLITCRISNEKTTFGNIIKKEIKGQLGQSHILIALRLCYRYFRTDLQLLEQVIKDIKDGKNAKVYYLGKMVSIIDHPNMFPKDELELLPEMVKQMLDLH